MPALENGHTRTPESPWPASIAENNVERHRHQTLTSGLHMHTCTHTRHAALALFCKILQIAAQVQYDVEHHSYIVMVRVNCELDKI